MVPARLAIYYGYPSLVNGSAGNIEKASAIFAKYDIMVLGDGLEFGEVDRGRIPQGAGTAEHDNTQRIISLLKTRSPRTAIYGYVCLGSTQHLSQAELQHRIKLWNLMDVHGIFLDEAGYDYGVTRERQNGAIAYVHQLGLSAFLNAFRPDDLFSTERQPLNSAGGGNPQGIPAVLGNRDIFLLESFQINNGAYETAVHLAERTGRAVLYRERYGSRIMAVTTTVSGSSSSLAEQFDYAWGSAFLWSLNGFGWGSPSFGSADNMLAISSCNQLSATMPKRFLSSVHVADAAFWRETTEGRLVLDAHEHKVMLRRPARPDLILSCGTAP